MKKDKNSKQQKYVEYIETDAEDLDDYDTSISKERVFITSTKDYIKGTKVTIVEYQKKPTLIGMHGIIIEMPSKFLNIFLKITFTSFYCCLVHPSTWFKIKLENGEVYTFRPSSFRVIDKNNQIRASKFDFLPHRKRSGSLSTLSHDDSDETSRVPSPIIDSISMEKNDISAVKKRRVSMSEKEVRSIIAREVRNNLYFSDFTFRSNPVSQNEVLYCDNCSNELSYPSKLCWNENCSRSPSYFNQDCYNHKNWRNSHQSNAAYTSNLGSSIDNEDDSLAMDQILTPSPREIQFQSISSLNGSLNQERIFISPATTIDDSIEESEIYQSHKYQNRFQTNLLNHMGFESQGVISILSNLNTTTQEAI